MIRHQYQLHSRNVLLATPHRCSALIWIRKAADAVGFEVQFEHQSQTDLSCLCEFGFPLLSNPELRYLPFIQYPFARWRTAPDLNIRIDCSFYIACMNDKANDKTQSNKPNSLWLKPQIALQHHSLGSLHLTESALRILILLASFQNTESLLKTCIKNRSHHMQPIRSRAGFIAGERYSFVDGETGYGELSMVYPQGQLMHCLDWQSQRVVPLLLHVQRLTAANAGKMTGPGTNTYLIGERATGYIVLDPGPSNLPDHLERLMAATLGDIRYILCTHSHPDHSPGAKPLQELVYQSQRVRPPICGIPSGPFANEKSFFIPDQTLRDGDQIQLASSSQDITHSLRAIHTPGHASNHLCFVLLEDGLLFSGDHILGGTTVVISPPDGNMQDYLDSLDTLLATCTQYEIEFILPAHGHVLHAATKTIAQLKSHRLGREKKVLHAIKTLPDGSLQDWLGIAYQDTPAEFLDIARQSLLAHVQRLANLHPDIKSPPNAI